MAEAEAARLSFPRKSDIEALRERNNAWKYHTLLTLRDEKGMSWHQISDQTHYCVPEVRRIYFRAKKFADENPDLLSSGAFANAPIMTKDKVNYIEAGAINSLNRAVLYMRDTQNLMFKEISELTGFSISRLICIYGKLASAKQAARERLSKATQPMETTNHQKETVSTPEIGTAHPPFMQKSDAWLLKAGINAQKYQTVLELRDRQKLSWLSIGNQMHYSNNQVQRYYARAKKLLELLAENPDLQLPEEYPANRYESDGTAAVPVIKQEEVRFSKVQIRNELYRTVLNLRDEHGLIFKEIAKRMGFSKSYVKTLYREASRLKRMTTEKSGVTTQSRIKGKEENQKNVNEIYMSSYPGTL